MRLPARIAASPVMSIAVFCFAAVLFSFAGAAPAAVLTPAQILRVTFTTSPTPNPVPDTMTMNLGVVQVLQAHTTRSGALYDGNTLLGVAMTSSFGGNTGALSLSPAVSWKSPTSLWNFDNPGTVNFTSIANGTINGRIDFTIATGAMDINLANVSLGLGRATAGNVQNVTSPPPTITSVEIVPVPEPATLGVLALLPLLTARRRRAALTA